jgi:hypothetical protein
MAILTGQKKALYYSLPEKLSREISSFKSIQNFVHKSFFSEDFFLLILDAYGLNFFKNFYKTACTFFRLVLSLTLPMDKVDSPEGSRRLLLRRLLRRLLRLLLMSLPRLLPRLLPTRPSFLILMTILV